MVLHLLFMLFNSLQFLLFFVIVSTIYYCLPLIGRWIWLLLASCYFYAVLNPYYLIILATAICIDYVCGIALLYSQRQQWRKVILLISILSNVAILVYFKYHNFFIDNLVAINESIGYHTKFSYLSLVLPIGLSFHTFQSMSYCIEVFRKNQAPEKNPLIFALYVMFFPQLVAGPIERPNNLLPQLHKQQTFSTSNIQSGLMLMAWGLYKKVVIADRVSIYVNQVYANAEQYSSIGLLVAIFFFSFQIYCDFSGYSDMARGAAKVLGYELMLNFNAPYFSTSLKQFWTRWHISLSSWFKDYVYIPLGGAKVSNSRYMLNILLVFLLSGFWHGANWTFVVWGLLHGLFLVATMQIGTRIKWPNSLSTLLTFCFVSISWIFFRSTTLQNAIHFLFNLFSVKDGLISNEYFSLSHILFSLGLIVLLLFIEKKYIQNVLNTRYFFAKISILALLIYFLGIFSQAQFIYFQF
jgi:alginate O-acetyltransferase complex protein AlgI